MKKFCIALLVVVAASAQEPTTNREHTAWIATSLQSMETIKVGMTRQDLLKVFTTEGGISNRLRRTYVYKQCRYIKIDVEFAPVGDIEQTLVERPEDKIMKLSRPYLQWTVAD